MNPAVRAGRDLAFGILVAGLALGLTFFGTAGAVELTTLAVAIAGVIWFATVDPRRLVDESDTPNLMLFGLTTLGVGVVGTAAVIIQTTTLFLVAAVVLVGGITGLVRAIRFRLHPPPGA